MGNWAELCDDLLLVIVDKFSAIEDMSHFGGVCRSWRSISVEKWHFSIADPWLMLAEKEDSDNRGFYSLSTKKVYHLNLPESCSRKCWSSYDWLITLRPDLEIHLLNPFSRSRVAIRLPPQPSLPNQYRPGSFGPEYIYRVFIHKVILSSRPSLSVKTPCEDDEKCVVMGIFSQYRRLAFLRLGDEAWTPVYTPKGTGINNVVYLNGQFYAIADGGILVIVDIFCPNPKTVGFAEPPKEYDECARSYFVELHGELFLLAHDIDEASEGKVGEDSYRYVLQTKDFNVYKFDFDNMKWTQVFSLDNRALFVGVNNSFAIFPSNNSGYEPNCIYFTDDLYTLMLKQGAGHDMGVFWMEGRKVEFHVVHDNLSQICAPLWIRPT